MDTTQPLVIENVKSGGSLDFGQRVYFDANLQGGKIARIAEETTGVRTATILSRTHYGEMTWVCIRLASHAEKSFKQLSDKCHGLG